MNDGVCSVFKFVEAFLLDTFGKSLFLPWGRKIIIPSMLQKASCGAIKIITGRQRLVGVPASLETSM